MGMFRPEVKIRIEEELVRAEAARSQGLEGRARVCARRAAGAAIRAYLETRGLEPPGPSVMDLLAYLQNLPDSSDEIRQISERLQTRVDEDHSLPFSADLLAEVRRLIEILEEIN
jgi:hypothetical protein